MQQKLDQIYQMPKQKSGAAAKAHSCLDHIHRKWKIVFQGHQTPFSLSPPLQNTERPQNLNPSRNVANMATQTKSPPNFINRKYVSASVNVLYNLLFLAV